MRPLNPSILLAFFLGCQAMLSLAHADPMPPPAIFSSPLWYDGNPAAALPAALNKGVVRIAFLQTDGGPALDLAFDFEAALRSWLLRLDFSAVRIEQVKHINEADLVLHYGPEPLHSVGSRPRAFHYRAPMEDGRIVSIVHVSSAQNPDLVSLRAGLALGNPRVKWRGADREIRITPLSELYGKAENPDAVSRQLIDNQGNGRLGGWFQAEEGIKEIAYWTMVHELGHAFGLGDQYARDGFVPEDLGATVMTDGGYRPLVPTDLDVSRVSLHSCRSGLLQRCAPGR